MIGKYRLPVITLILIAANFFGSVLVTLDPDIISKFGFVAGSPTLASLVVGPFLHLNLIHLLGNLIFLAAVGGSLELATGSGRFLVVYVLSALAGEGVQFLAFHHNPNAGPLVGASAAVAGCASYYAIRYFRLKIPVAPKVNLPILAVVGVWALLQALGAFIHIGHASSAVSFWSHLGGLSMGVLLCVLFKAPDLGQDKLDEAVLDDARRQGPQVMLHAAKEILKAKPKDLSAWRQLAEAAKMVGDRDEEQAALVSLVELDLPAQRSKWIQRLFEIDRITALTPTKRFSLGKDLAESDPHLAGKLFRSIGYKTGSELQAEALFELGNLYYKRDPDQALDAMKRLDLDCPNHPLHTQARARGWIK